VTQPLLLIFRWFFRFVETLVTGASPLLVLNAVALSFLPKQAGLSVTCVLSLGRAPKLSIACVFLSSFPAFRGLASRGSLSPSTPARENVKYLILSVNRYHIRCIQTRAQSPLWSSSPWAIRQYAHNRPIGVHCVGVLRIKATNQWEAASLLCSFHVNLSVLSKPCWKKVVVIRFQARPTCTSFLVI